MNFYANAWPNNMCIHSNKPQCPIIFSTLDVSNTSCPHTELYVCVCVCVCVSGHECVSLNTANKETSFCHWGFNSCWYYNPDHTHWEHEQQAAQQCVCVCV